MSENINEINNNSPRPGTSSQSNTATNVWPHKTNWVKCDICNVYLTSNKLLEVHLNGKKHNLIVQKLQDREWNYTCYVCGVRTNGRLQYAEHIAGKVHRSHLEKQEGYEDIFFFSKYTAVASLLLFIFVYYLLYFMFTYLN